MLILWPVMWQSFMGVLPLPPKVTSTDMSNFKPILDPFWKNL